MWINRIDWFFFSTQNCHFLKKKIMEKSELRIVSKYYFLQGMGYRSIYKEINTALLWSDISLSSAQHWCRKFSSGDLSCNALPRSGRPKLNITNQIREMLEEQSFLSAKYIASELKVSANSIKTILFNDLGLKKYRRRWIPHFLSENDKEKRAEYSKLILDELIKARKKILIHLWLVISLGSFMNMIIKIC